MFELEMAKKIRALEKQIQYLMTLEKGTGGGGGGVIAHGDLSGLGNDDHTQYFNETRGDARYLGLTAKAVDSDKLDGIDSSDFVQTSGVQTINDVKTFGSILVLPSTDPTTDNQAVRKAYVDNLHIRYAARAYRDATAFSYATSGTIYALPLNQEEWDTHSHHDNVTNNTRITCKKAGMYTVNGALTFAANATGNRDLLLRLNGTEYFAQQRLEAFASGSCTLNAFGIIPLAVNDYVELCGRQYSGGALGSYYANSNNNYLSIYRLGE